MTPADLDALAKAPLLVHLAITGANSGPTSTDRSRFKELLVEAHGENARVCVYTDAMRHLAANGPRLHDEISAAGNTRPVLQSILPILRQELPHDERMRFVSFLGRVAFSAARDDAGTPVPERIAVLQQLREAFGFPAYGSFSKRFTDKLEITNYWPGSDPALQRFSDAELRKLSGVFGCLFSTLLGCHGGEMDESKEAAVKGWLMAGYTPGHETCATHALLRYLDQLFMLVQIEAQYTESSRPVFAESRDFIREKLSEAEQGAFMQHFHALGEAIATPDSPPAAHDMWSKIQALMRGEDVDDLSSALTEEEWDVLSLGLVASFLLVAAVDGNVGDKETEAFGGIIAALCELTHLGPAYQAAARISDNLHKLLPVATSGKAPTPQYVVDALQLASARLAEVDFDAYRMIAMTIAEKAAEAEGGGFLGLGSKISADERKVLDGLKKLLGLA